MGLSPFLSGVTGWEREGTDFWLQVFFLRISLIVQEMYTYSSSELYIVCLTQNIPINYWGIYKSRICFRETDNSACSAFYGVRVS